MADELTPEQPVDNEVAIGARFSALLAERPQRKVGGRPALTLPE